MSIFGRLFSSWGGRSDSIGRDRAMKSWGLADPDVASAPANEDGVTAGPFDPTSPDLESSNYDRVNWRKKLTHLLDTLPGSEPAWADFMADAHALNFGDGWIASALREEFTLLVRRAVVDSVVTDAEYRKLDLAHQLIGMSDAEAERIFHEVVTDAEQFFGTRIEGA